MPPEHSSSKAVTPALYGRFAPDLMRTCAFVEAHTSTANSSAVEGRTDRVWKHGMSAVLASRSRISNIGPNVIVRRVPHSVWDRPGWNGASQKLLPWARGRCIGRFVSGQRSAGLDADERCAAGASALIFTAGGPGFWRVPWRGDNDRMDPSGPWKTSSVFSSSIPR